MNDDSNIDPFDQSSPQPEGPSVSQDPFAQDDDPRRRMIVLGISAVVAVGCCVAFFAAFLYFQPDQLAQVARYFPSATATLTNTPTSTPTNTSTPTQTATPTPNLTATAAMQQATVTAGAIQTIAANAANTWRVSLKESFNNNNRQWVMDTADDEYAKTEYSIKDGIYRWDINSHKGMMSWVRANSKPYSNFSMSADIQQMEGPESADYGLVFREDPKQNFYYFGVNKQGQYFVLVFNNEWITLKDWTNTDLIQFDKPNKLTVIAQGTHFLFFINGQFLTELTDDKISSGTLALAVELADADQHAVIQFDNVEIRVP